MVIDGATAGANPTIPFVGLIDHGSGASGVPNAYLTMLVFDLNYSLVNSAFKQIGSSAEEDGTDVNYEYLSISPITIEEAGYVYIYLSNENGTPIEVFFDDFTVTHTNTDIVQKDDYYPFGLTFNSYTRTASTAQNYLYNGKELQSETEWYDYGFRMYDPAIARWHVLDAHAGKYPSWSPYNYVMNNPILLIDFMGLDPVYRDGKYYETDDDGNEYEVSWDYVQGWLQDNDYIAASYSFESSGSGTTITETKKGKTNSFTYNGQSFTANSMATLMGRDDRDNSIGAFSGVETISELGLENLLGHATSIFYDMYYGNIEKAVLDQSVTGFIGSGLLDYKNKLYDILGFDRNALVEINGVTYNANEAGNFVWGMVIEYAGGLISPNMIAEIGTRGRADESWEQKAITAGRNYGLELLKRDDAFKKRILFQRVQFRAGDKSY